MQNSSVKFTKTYQLDYLSYLERERVNGHKRTLLWAGREASDNGLHTGGLRPLIRERSYPQTTVWGELIIASCPVWGEFPAIGHYWQHVWHSLKVAALEKTIDSRNLDIQILERRVSNALVNSYSARNNSVHFYNDVHVCIHIISMFF